MHERSENYAGQIASREITKNIAAGASICAAVAGTVWKRTAYIDHHTGETGILHQCLRGRPGTKRNKIYSAVLNINSEKL